MTNKYHDYDNDLIPGSTARSGVMDAELQAIETSFESVEADMFRTIRFTGDGAPAEADFEIPQTAVQRANTTLGFDADGKAAVVADAVSWSGAWATSTDYLARTVVMAPESHYFSIYIARVAHTSSDFATDLGSNRWDLMIDMEPIYKSRLRHQLKGNTDSPIAAVAGDDLMIDVTDGPVTVVLPASPAITDAPINLIHVDGDIVANPITIDRNGNRIMGLQEDMTVDVENGSFGLVYCDALRGWRVRGV